MIDNLKFWLPGVIQIAKKAGEYILQIYAANNLKIEYKTDHSPVTQADLAAHKIIQHGLENLAIKLPILSEEGLEIPFAVRNTWKSYWLIDPLDGTKEFIHGTDEFTVNICLISQHIPVMGVVFVPARQELFSAIKGEPAVWHKHGQNSQVISIKHLDSTTQDHKLRVEVSRRHGASEKLQRLLTKIKNYDLISCGSALKICLVAKGDADLYPRFGATSEWDTAAGQCILEAAGGEVLDLSGNKLIYNTKESLVNPEFVATSSRKIFDSLF
jgi:3'(2'), 5'-bisphosphate nucleotidase